MTYDSACHAKLVGLAAHARLSWQHWFSRARATRLGLSDDRYGGAYALDGAAIWRRHLAPPPGGTECADSSERGGGLMAPSHRRWIVLANDGRHSTLGRDTAPDDADIAAAGSALAGLGLVGWLVRLDGDYWSRRAPVVFTMIQPLSHAVDADWPAAVAAFEAMRIAATSSKVRSSPSRMAG